MGTKILLLFSVLAFLGCLYFVFIHNLWVKRKLQLTTGVLLSTGCLMFAIVIFHYAVTYDPYAIWQSIFESVIHTFKSFSMDAEYEEFIPQVRDLAAKCFGDIEIFRLATVGYMFLIGVLAPVFGGAVLFTIITTIFPEIRLWIAGTLFWKDICYFSELNDRSLALAKSLIEENNNFLTRRIIVFTDAYSDEEEEVESERLYAAKSIGAILLKKDLKHIHVRERGSNHFFLIDEKESDNIYTMTMLADDEHYKSLKKAYVYVFMQEYEQDLVEFEMLDKLEKKFVEDKKEKLEKKLKKKSAKVSAKIIRVAFKNYTRARKIANKARKRLGKDMKKAKEKMDAFDAKEMLPVIKPVKCYRNMANNLLFKVPLYEPLIEKQKDEDGKHKLNVTIVGTGAIGEEVFLSTYWFGQILDTELYINFVSKETEDDFKDKIDRKNTEIFESGTKVGVKKQSEILRIYPDKEEYAEPYFQYRYYNTDLNKGDLHGKFTESRGDFRLVDSDYIIVALGSDEANVTVAESIKRSLTIARFGTAPKRIVVAFAVFDSDLCKSLKHDHYEKDKDGIDSGIYMYPFGSVEELYSCENIFMRKSEISANIGEKNYNKNAGIDVARKKVAEKDSIESLRGRRDGDYTYWANRARAMHIKYKVFAAGYITKSIFNEGHEEAFVKSWNAYRKVMKKRDLDDKMQQYLAWMEHRRWNAFTRSMGLRLPTKEELIKYFEETKQHKNLRLRLHPLLVECDKEAMNKETYTMKCADVDGDALDITGGIVVELKSNVNNYKIYDYPDGDFEDEKGEVFEMNDYIPCPIDTGDTNLSEDLLELTELIAKNVHEVWAEGRISQGWTYGEERNDEKKTTPCLVDYEKLTEEEKEYDRKTAMETLKLILTLGYRIEKK